jgi:hypothetical protein
VAAILIAAFAIRLGYIENTPYHAINDAGTYNRLASNIAEYGDYHTGSKPGSGAGGSRGPTAYFPPGYPYFLAAVDLLDGHQAGGKSAIKGERISQAVLGTITVALIGLVALEAFGGVVALVAMALAAIYPVIVELSGTLVAENLLLVFELGGVWTALRACRSPRPYPWIIATGVLTGLATLTHQNAVLFVIPFSYAAWLATRRRQQPAASTPAHPPRGRTGSFARGLAAPATLLIVALITIAPWTIRNADELHAFVPVSDQGGITLVGTYNPDSAAFSLLPYKWRFFWFIAQDQHLRHTAGHYTEAELGSKLQSQALSYVGHHPFSPIEVAYRNTLRLFELEGPYAWHASALAIGLSVSDARWGVGALWLLCLFAIAGAFTPVARAAPRWIWGIPLLLLLSIVFVNAETPRFREPIDPFLLMLAACALATAGRWLLVRAGLLHLRRAPVRSGR